MIHFEKITQVNFCESSLDNYVRTQSVTHLWRNTNGEYRLTEHSFVDDWSPEQKRQKAREALRQDVISYAAFDGNQVVGFIILLQELYGVYMVLDNCHVSGLYRGRGIGRRLFDIAQQQARAAGAKKLYVSACPSQETVAFYRAMGCLLAQMVIPQAVEAEPDDLQLEYVLKE